jgi:hypothetical protein
MRSTAYTERLNQLYRRLVPLGRIFQNCQNSLCDQCRIVWPPWMQSSAGMCLQGNWYCSPDCFENAAYDLLLRLASTPEAVRKRAYRLPIGLLLLARGLINDAQLKQALSLQKEKGAGRIGEFLQEIHAISEQDFTTGLAAQWGCPVYPLDRVREFLQCASLLPMTLLETVRMLPVHYLPVQQTLYLAFVDGVDHTALYAVEQMLHLRTIPCIVSESALRRAFEALHQAGDTPTTVFDSPSEPREMARTTRSYAWQVGAEDVSMARSGRFLWIRLKSGQRAKDILFQSPASVLDRSTPKGASISF